MKAICSSETSIDFRRIIRRYVTEYRTHNYRCENLRFCVKINCAETKWINTCIQTKRTTYCKIWTFVLLYINKIIDFVDIIHCPIF
jgi:hypothetical protein